MDRLTQQIGHNKQWSIKSNDPILGIISPQWRCILDVVLENVNISTYRLDLLSSLRNYCTKKKLFRIFDLCELYCHISLLLSSSRLHLKVAR